MPSGIDFNGAGGGHSLSELFYARQLFGDVRRGARRVARGATAAPRAIGRRGSDIVTGAANRRLESARLGQSEAARELAREELQTEGRAALERRNAEQHRAELARAQQVFADEKRLSSKSDYLDYQIKQKQGNMTLRSNRGRHPESRLLKRLPRERAKAQQELADLRSSSEYARAQSTVGSKPREVTDRDVGAWVKNRRSQLDRKPDSPVNLRAAGIDQEEFDRADAVQKDVYREKSYGVMQHQRDLLDRAGVGKKVDEHRPMGFRERRKVHDEMLDSGRLDRYRDLSKERARQHRQDSRTKRRIDRRRRNVR
jgi:hypothetical protein